MTNYCDIYEKKILDLMQKMDLSSVRRFIILYLQFRPLTSMEIGYCYKGTTNIKDRDKWINDYRQKRAEEEVAPRLRQLYIQLRNEYYLNRK